MGDHDYSANEQTQCDKPFLSIVKTVIKERNARSCQHLFGVREVQTMFSKIAAALRFVPLVVQFVG